MKKSYGILAAVAVCSLGLSSAAQAQEAGWWGASVAEQERALKKVASGPDKMRAFAMCAARQRAAAVSNFLGTARDTQEETNAFRRLMARANDCLPSGEFDSQALSMRGALAEAMFWSNYKGLDIDQQGFAATKPADPTLQFGMCTVASNATGVRALTATTPGSGEERAQFNTLKPALQACLTAGATMGMDPTALRSSLAQALYQAAAKKPDLAMAE